MRCEHDWAVGMRLKLGARRLPEHDYCSGPAEHRPKNRAIEHGGQDPIRDPQAPSAVTPDQARARSMHDPWWIVGHHDDVTTQRGSK
jgi:hypothetical protein